MQLEIRQIFDYLEVVKSNIEPDTKFSGISFDSRTIRPGEIFVPVNTGVNYIDHAFERGAVCAVVQNGIEIKCSGQAMVRVKEEAFQILRQLAKLWRSKVRCKIIAVTGSSGKTTTTQMVAHFLRSKFQVHCTDQNHNNHIGVPETIFGIDENTEFAVIELGTNQYGEIENLAMIIRPDIAVITSIGHAHLEFFHTVHDIRREKMSLLRYVKPNGIAIVHQEEKNTDEVMQLGGSGREVILFGANPECQIQLTASQCSGNWSGFEVDGKFGTKVLQCDYYLPQHNIMNALVAIAIARQHGIGWNAIQSQLNSFSSPQMRFEKQEINGVIVINDAYNANPDSMRAAIFAAQAISKSRLVLVLGDMFELGRYSKRLHQELGLFIEDNKIDVLVAIGEGMYHTIAALDQNKVESYYFGKVFHQSDTLSLTEIIRPNDVVLFKASRGMRLDVLHDNFCDVLELNS